MKYPDSVRNTRPTPTNRAVTKVSPSCLPSFLSMGIAGTSLRWFGKGGDFRDGVVVTGGVPPGR